MLTSRKKLYILDGNALLHRAWHAIPPLTTREGLVVNAVYGFVMFIEKIKEKFKPDYFAVAWDLKGPTFRHDACATYKAQRKVKEQELYDQIPMIREVLAAYNIPCYDAVGYEADDVIGTIAELVKKNSIDTVILTGDTDMFQLIDDHTAVLSFAKGLSDTKLYDENAVRERFDLTPLELIEYKSLRGDPSDNIPGVLGIGEKGAYELIKKFGSIQGIFSALEKNKVDEKFAKKLHGQEDVAKQARFLVEIVQNVPIEFDFEKSKLQTPDVEKLKKLFERFEFRSLLRRYDSTKQVSVESIKPAEQPKISEYKKTNTRVEIVRDPKQTEVALVSLYDDQLSIFLSLQSPDLFGCSRACVSISDGKKSVVIPNPNEDHMKKVFEKLQRAKTLIMCDEKILLKETGWNFSAPIFDVMIAAYLLNAGDRESELSSVFKSVFGSKAMEVPTIFSSDKDFENHGAICLELHALKDQLKTKLERSNMLNVFEEIETPLVPILISMEKNGIKLDVDALGEFSKLVKKEIANLENKIFKLSKREFNVASPSQLAGILFVDLDLPTKGIKKTKTGYSTAASELEKLWEAHEIIPLISDHRELSKLQSTYVEALPKIIGADGRIHTTYNQTVTATGRLSSSEPNLQNIPIRTELGREIRKAFISEKNHVLVSADYSQIELRLVAVLAKDSSFIEAFKDGADIHTRTASQVLGIPENEITKEQRRSAKAINFGIIYGMGPRSLSRSTGLSMTEAKNFIDKYFEIHNAVKDFLDQTKIKAHDLGYVETFFGRRRYFPEINSGMQMLVAQAERMAINMPVQGTAADIMKMSMIAVDGWIKQSKLRAKILLQVHDELVLEVNEEDVDQVAHGLKEIMESVTHFEVPLEVDVKIGKNWGTMDEI